MNTVVKSTKLLELTSWAAPPWADMIETSGDQIEYSRSLGAVPATANQAEETLAVVVIQRDEMRVQAQRIDVIRHPAEILTGGMSLRPDEAHTLAQLLHHATAMVTASDG